VRQKGILALVLVYALVALGPVRGYDSYYFCTAGFSAPPAASFVFHHIPCGIPRQILTATISVADALLLAWGGVPPAMLIAFPLVGYTWRMEDDQLAYPLIILAAIFWKRKDIAKAIFATTIAMFFWRGAVVLLGAEILALTGWWGTVLPFLVWGLAHTTNAIGEQSVLAGILSLVILLPALKTRAKKDLLVWELGALSIGWGKWLWTLLPLLYLYYAELWRKIPRDVERIAVVAGVVGALILYATQFPSPFATKEIEQKCLYPSPDQWGIGWWCKAHGYDYPYAGSPPGSVVSSTARSSNVTRTSV